MKTAFILAITSARRVSELHALSVSLQCLRWGPEDSQVTLWLNPAFQPKVLSPQFMNQPIQLAAFMQEGRASRAALCPVRMLKQYVLRTASLCVTDQLLSVLESARKVHLCQNKGLLTGWRTRLWKNIVQQVVYCLQLLNVIPLEEWLLLMQHYGVCLSRKYVRQLHGNHLAHSQDLIGFMCLLLP